MTSLDELVKDTVERNHKDNFYRDLKDMIKIIEECLEAENATDQDILKAEIDDEMTWGERQELKRQNESFKRHGFERVKAIVKDYETVFKND